jgi:DNA mismatch endonuclease, patch repair protein
VQTGKRKGTLARKSRRALIVDAKTSARLGRVRQKGTSPELAVRRALASLGHRYRVTNRDLPGSPDLANRTRKWVVFVHGCFWHSHVRCARATIPKRNVKFWRDKFTANRLRDRRAKRLLERAGYRTVVIWECQTEDSPSLLTRLRRELRPAARISANR